VTAGSGGLFYRDTAFVLRTNAFQVSLTDEQKLFGESIPGGSCGPCEPKRLWNGANEIIVSNVGNGVGDGWADFFSRD
jgi:hypothetical protein